jgi:Mg-chelatase subunit ChlD
VRKNNSGFKIVFLLIFIVVGAGALLANGIFPNSIKSLPQNQDVQNIPINPTSSASSKSLQLVPIQFIQKQCGQTLGVDFLVDNSGSMSNGQKLSELKKGLVTFINGFTDTSVVGMQKFSDTPSDVIPLSYFKDVKNQMTRDVNSMQASGWTYTKNAFIFTKQKLDSQTPKFPNYKFALIFVSDGVPENAAGNAACGGNRCFAKDQDPTQIAAQIKQEGIRIFTIAYVDRSDASLNTQLQTMMRNVASSPDDYYSAPDATQISSILSQISTKLCQ